MLYSILLVIQACIISCIYNIYSTYIYIFILSVYIYITLQWLYIYIFVYIYIIYLLYYMHIICICIHANNFMALHHESSHRGCHGHGGHDRRSSCRRSFYGCCRLQAEAKPWDMSQLDGWMKEEEQLKPPDERKSSAYKCIRHPISFIYVYIYMNV